MNPWGKPVLTIDLVILLKIGNYEYDTDASVNYATLRRHLWHIIHVHVCEGV